MPTKFSLSNLTCVSTNVNLSDYLNLVHITTSHLKNPNFFGYIDRPILEKMLRRHAKIWLYYDAKTPVCTMMLIPASSADLAKFQLSSDLDPTIVADYGPQMVHPDYIGYGLQFQMLRVLDRYARHHGYSYALATVHPGNLYSSRNFLRDGFTLQGHVTLKRGPRDVYLKKLS